MNAGIAPASRQLSRHPATLISFVRDQRLGRGLQVVQNAPATSTLVQQPSPAQTRPPPWMRQNCLARPALCSHVGGQSARPSQSGQYFFSIPARAHGGLQWRLPCTTHLLLALPAFFSHDGGQSELPPQVGHRCFGFPARSHGSSQSAPLPCTGQYSLTLPARKQSGGHSFDPSCCRQNVFGLPAFVSHEGGHSEDPPQYWHMDFAFPAFTHGGLQTLPP